MPEESQDRPEGPGSAGGPTERGQSFPDDDAIARMAEACGCGPAMRAMPMTCCATERRSMHAAARSRRGRGETS